MSAETEQKLLHEIERLQAINAIQNCQGHYEFVHLTPAINYRTVECFAMWRPDVSCEVSDWGCFFGPEAVKTFWSIQTVPDPELLKGGIFWHSVATPVIQVAGDGKTAKCTWMSPGFETMPPFPDDPEQKYTCFWCFGKYAMDYIKNPETGEWKIWHFKWMRTIRNEFHTDWYTDSKNTLKGMPGRDGGMGPGCKPSVFHRPYSADQIPHPFPCDPQPYEHYNGDFRWIFGGEELEKEYDVHYPAYEKFYHVNYPENV